MADAYFKHDHLKNFGDVSKASPDLGAKFFDYYTASLGEGALTKREKSLIALASAHLLQCPYCIEAHTEGCLEAGSNEQEMIEAVHVAAAMRAGSTLVHAMQMKEKADGLSM